MKVQLIGVNQCLAALKALPVAVQRKHMRVALNAAGGIIKKDVVPRVPRRSGLLRQSIGVKVQQKKNGEWFTAVGVKRGMQRGIRATRKGRIIALSKRKTSNLKFTPGGGSVQQIRPSRYLHLVEGGTKSHVVSIKSKKVLAGNGGIWGRRVTIRSSPKNFMATAAAVSGYAAQAKAITKLKEAILSEANRNK